MFRGRAARAEQSIVDTRVRLVDRAASNSRNSLVPSNSQLGYQPLPEPVPRERTAPVFGPKSNIGALGNLARGASEWRRLRLFIGHLSRRNVDLVVSDIASYATVAIMSDWASWGL